MDSGHYLSHIDLTCCRAGPTRDFLAAVAVAWLLDSFTYTKCQMSQALSGFDY